MRSLFIRIFLWFWSATVLLVAVLLGTIYLTEPEPQTKHWRSLTRHFLDMYGRNAADDYEENGCVALDRLLANNNPFPDNPGRRVLTDASGNPLCGYELDSTLIGTAKEAASAKQEPFRWERNLLHERSPLTATRIVSESGKVYVLLFDVPRIRPPHFNVPPSTWALRALAVLLTAGLVCYGLARHFAAPVRRLRAVARRFAAGDLKARVGADRLLNRRDEIAELGKDFDDMALRIESLVTRQEQLLESQRRLLGDISHELRSPLTRLALASGLLQRKVSDDAKPLLSRIDRESERLNILIGQLLTLARLDVNPVPEVMETFELNVLIQEIVDDAAFEAAANNVRIEYTAQSKCILNGARELIRSAVENVLRNAVRYTADGTAVIVELECTSRLTSITVSDHGPGVPEKDLPHLFEPFYRVAKARDRQSGGTGLGLTIAERTVRLHGGALEAFNRPKGGLSVSMTFPCAEKSASAQQAVPTEAVS